MPAIAPAEMPFFVVMFSPQARDDVAEEDDMEAGDDTENDVEDVMDADGLVAVPRSEAELKVSVTIRDCEDTDPLETSLDVILPHVDFRVCMHWNC